MPRWFGGLRGLRVRPLLMLLSAWLALVPALALANRPGDGEPFGVDWTPIVFWAVVGGVIMGGLLLGLLIDSGNR
jgi:hypothetical protein